MSTAGASINKHFGSVRVYALVDPAVLFENGLRIAAELFGMSDLQEGGRTFSVHPASGYLFYADYDELWKSRTASELPMDRSEAERIAREFIETGNKKIMGNRTLQQGHVPTLFPSDIRPIWIGGVVPKSSSTPDHCLCQFAVFLAADQRRTGRVEGAVIDVRIGGKGKIIGLSSRWRPPTGDTLSTEPIDIDERKPLYADSPMTIRKPEARAIPAIAKPTPPSLDTQDDNPENPPEYLFWLADENAPQAFLSPILLQRSDDDAEAEAASRHSLIAEIWQRNSGDQLHVLAVVNGGSGNYEYQWGYWEHDSVFAEGIKLAGTSPSTSFDRGIYNVLLQVRDKLTGATTQVEKVIFPNT